MGSSSAIRSSSPRTAPGHSFRIHGPTPCSPVQGGADDVRRSAGSDDPDRRWQARRRPTLQRQLRPDAVLARTLGEPFEEPPPSLHDPEGEARSRLHLVHDELLELDTAQIDVIEETTSGAEQDRHHVDAELVGQSRTQDRARERDAADHQYRPVAGGTGRLSYGRLEAI